MGAQRPRTEAPVERPPAGLRLRTTVLGEAMQTTGTQETTVTLAAGGDEQQLVVFELGAELYGVEIARVHEIICLQTVTRVPRAPAFVEGVINLRGKVI